MVSVGRISEYILEFLVSKGTDHEVNVKFLRITNYVLHYKAARCKAVELECFKDVKDFDSICF